MNRWITPVLACLIAAGSAAAQQPAQDTKSEAARNKVIELLQKGDGAAAQNLAATLASELSGNTFFEEIRGCGLYPQETRLECVIDIKQNFGYIGNVPLRGSLERVAFFVDWNGNGTFDSTEYVGEGDVLVHDGSARTTVAVYRDFDPLGAITSNGPRSAGFAPIVNARAVLSWHFTLCDPNQRPIWGNVVDFRIRLTPIR